MEDKAITPRSCCVALVAWVLAICLAPGCATEKPLVQLPEVPPKLETLEDAWQLLNQNYGYAQSAKASGEISVKLQREESWRPASLVLMVEKPDKVRVRAYRSLTPTLFELVSDGQKCWLFIPSENTAYLDENCNVLQGGEKAIAISAEAIVAALMVVSDIDKLFSVPASVSRDSKNLRLAFGGKGGVERDIWMDLKTGFVTHQSFFGLDGEIEADLAYTEMDVLDTGVFPTEISLKLPRFHSSMVLRIGEFQVNPRISAGAFSFSPPRGAKILPPSPQRLESYFSGEL